MGFLETIRKRKKPSNFFGTLNIDEGEKMQKYLIESRNEWERNEILS